MRSISGFLFVKENGDTVLRERGRLTDRDIHKIQMFIKERYQEMYLLWAEYSRQGFYRGE